jgi:hypothetical protein
VFRPRPPALIVHGLPRPLAHRFPAVTLIVPMPRVRCEDFVTVQAVADRIGAHARLPVAPSNPGRQTAFLTPDHDPIHEGRKSSEEEIFSVKSEENPPEEDLGFQTARITSVSARRWQPGLVFCTNDVPSIESIQSQEGTVV